MVKILLDLIEFISLVCYHTLNCRIFHYCTNSMNKGQIVFNYTIVVCGFHVNAQIVRLYISICNS